MSPRKRILEGLEDDIRFHIENETQDNIDRGMQPEDARRAALLKFGNVTRVIEDTREVWSTPWIERRLQDARFGFRMLRKHLSFAMAAVLSLALGIGANTAVFSLVDALLLQRLAVPHPEQLFSLVRVTPQERGESFSYPDFVALGARRAQEGECAEQHIRGEGRPHAECVEGEEQYAG